MRKKREIFSYIFLVLLCAVYQCCNLNYMYEKLIEFTVHHRLAGLIALNLICLIPTIIAALRKNRYVLPIFILNMFFVGLSWYFWAVLLSIAYIDERKESSVKERTEK